MSINKILVKSILPLIYLNVIVSEGQIKIGEFYVGLIFYWLLIIISFACYCLYFPSKIKQVSTFIIIIVFWIFDQIFSSDLTYVLHIITVNFLFFVMGGIAVIKFPEVVVKQLSIFLIINLPIMATQLLGVSEAVHVFNTLMWKYEPDGAIIKDVNIYPVLFKSTNEMIYNSAQGRPPGILHSNAALGPIILYISSFFIGNTSRKHIRLLEVILIASVVLVMAKIVFVTFFVLLFFAYRTAQSQVRKKYITGIFLISILFYFLYYIFLPGLFVNNLSLDAFFGSSFLRLIDTFIYFVGNQNEQQRLVELLSSKYSFNYIDDSDFGALSGFTSLVKIAPFVLVLMLIFKTKIKLLIKKAKSTFSIYYSISNLLLISILLTSFATALFKAPIFAYFLGIGLLPYLCILNNDYKRILNTN